MKDVYDVAGEQPDAVVGEIQAAIAAGVPPVIATQEYLVLRGEPKLNLHGDELAIEGTVMASEAASVVGLDVEMLSTSAGPGGVIERGQVVGMLREKAFELIAGGYARPLQHYISSTTLARLQLGEWKGGTRVRVIVAVQPVGDLLHGILEPLCAGMVRDDDAGTKAPSSLPEWWPKNAATIIKWRATLRKLRPAFEAKGNVSAAADACGIDRETASHILEWGSRSPEAHQRR